MKFRYLLALSCVFMIACNNGETAKKPADTTAKPAKVADAEPAKKVDAKPAKKVDAGEKTTTPAKDADPPVTAAGIFASIESDYNDAMKDFRDLYTAAAEEDRNKVFEEHYPKAEKYAKEFFTLAEDFPEDEVASKALLWVAQRARGAKEQGEATKKLLENYIDSEKLAGLCATLSYGSMGQDPIDQLTKLKEASPHDSVKASATYWLAELYSRMESAKQTIADSDSHRYTEEDVAFLKDFSVDKDKIEGLYNDLIEKFADFKPHERSKRTYKDMAVGSLFERNNLQVGHVAPEIEGEDLDGKSFKLSEYRGKVVVLDFWGDW